MTIVRDCTLDDIDFLMEKAIAFNSKYYDVPLNIEKLIRYLSQVITHECGIALRTDHGAILGAVTEDPLRDWTALIELAWYSEQAGEGVRLLTEFERRAVELGVDEIRVCNFDINPGVATLLGRKGYTPIETSHRRLLCPH